MRTPTASTGCVNRAVVLGNVIASPPVEARIAQRADVPAALLRIQAPITAHVASLPVNSQNSRSMTDILKSNEQYRIAIDANPAVPILDIYAQTPTAQSAAALANAAVDELKAYVAGLASTQATPAEDQTRIEQLGQATGTVINPGVQYQVAVLVFILIFLLVLRDDDLRLAHPRGLATRGAVRADSRGLTVFGAMELLPLLRWGWRRRLVLVGALVAAVAAFVGLGGSRSSGASTAVAWTQVTLDTPQLPASRGSAGGRGHAALACVAARAFDGDRRLDPSAREPARRDPERTWGSRSEPLGADRPDRNGGTSALAATEITTPYTLEVFLADPELPLISIEAGAPQASAGQATRRCGRRPPEVARHRQAEASVRPSRPTPIHVAKRSSRSPSIKLRRCR